MKKLALIPIGLLSIILMISSCDSLGKISIPVNTGSVLTESEIVGGLKEALNIGTNNAVSLLSKENGFFGDALVKIPFPEEAKRAETKLRELGMNKLVDDFILTMNRGAEKAVSKAGPIFANAITSMTFEDARNILKGPSNAATEYFKKKTSAQLFDLFKPEIKNALDAVNATKYWTDITSTYNKIPLVTPIETDLAKYVTNKALEALFMKIAIEEQKIRTDPLARVTDLLRKVFNPNAITY